MSEALVIYAGPRQRVTADHFTLEPCPAHGGLSHSHRFGITEVWCGVCDELEDRQRMVEFSERYYSERERKRLIQRFDELGREDISQMIRDSVTNP